MKKSAEEKTAILKKFCEEFHLSKKEAAGLLISSSHLLGKGGEVGENLKQVLSPSLPNFTEEQVNSSLDLLTYISRVAGPSSELQEQLIADTTKILGSKTTANSKWF